MAKLFGAQRMVLQAIQDSPKDSAGYVTDAEVAKKTGIELSNVHLWFDMLEGEKYIDLAIANGGCSAFINSKGRLELGLFPGFSSDALRGLWSYTSPRDRTFLLIVATASLACIILGFSMPVEPLSILAKTIGFIVIIFTSFGFAYVLSANYLIYGDVLARKGWEVSVPSVLIGAILYSLCMLSSEGSKCTSSNDPTIILERFGRFIIFGLPFGMAAPMVICSIINLMQESCVFNDPKQYQGSDKRNVAMLTILITVILISITCLISGAVQRFGLALPGCDLGTIDPVWHLGLTVIVFIAALTLVFHLEAKRSQASLLLVSTLRFLPAAISLVYLTSVLSYYDWTGEFVKEGTGIGVISSFVFALGNILYLASFSIRYSLRALIPNDTSTGSKPAGPAAG